MRDVTSYLRGDPEERLRDAWGEEESDAERLDRLQAEPRGRHHLDHGGRCTGPCCRPAQGATPSPEAEPTTHRICGRRGPGSLRCNRLEKKNEETGKWSHVGHHEAFSVAGNLVTW